MLLKILIQIIIFGGELNELLVVLILVEAIFFSEHLAVVSQIINILELGLDLPPAFQAMTVNRCNIAAHLGASLFGCCNFI